MKMIRCYETLDKALNYPYSIEFEVESNVEMVLISAIIRDTKTQDRISIGSNNRVIYHFASEDDRAMFLLKI